MAIKGYRKSGVSMLDFINMQIQEKERRITKEEFTHIRRFGTKEELARAVERMNAAGGYDNLE